MSPGANPAPKAGWLISANPKNLVPWFPTYEMSMERSFVMARWIPSDQVLTYGRRVLGSSASVLQGAGSVTGLVEPAGGKVNPSPHWSAKMLAGKMLPHAVVPPLTHAGV